MSADGTDLSYTSMRRANSMSFSEITLLSCTVAEAATAVLKSHRLFEVASIVQDANFSRLLEAMTIGERMLLKLTERSNAASCSIPAAFQKMNSRNFCMRR